MSRQYSGDMYHFSLCSIRNLMATTSAISNNPTIGRFAYKETLEEKAGFVEVKLPGFSFSYLLR
jgi:hypothetical protein